MKKKASIVVSILLLTVGFAAISTTLVINGNAVVGENAEDFEVIFTKATLDGEDVYESVVDDTKKVITFETNELKQANQKSVLNYEVTNNSTNYNAEVQINCKVKDETQTKYTSIKNELEGNTTIVKSKETLNGTVTITLNKVATESINEEYVCTLTFNATERTRIGEPSTSLYNMIKNNADTTTVIDFNNRAGTTGKETNGIYTTTSTEENVPVYYYRGAADKVNNNIIFGNFCWKIIRTTETGGIKLIYNGVPTDGKCNNTGDKSVAGYTAWNDSYDDNAYVGYMFGINNTGSSTSKEQAQTNTYASTIKTYLEDKWFENNLKDYVDYLEDTVFCNDRSTVSGGDNNFLGSSTYKTLGYGKNATGYGAMSRASNVTNTTKPSLICPQDNDKFTVNSENGNGKLKYPVGLITTDEMALAGYNSYGGNHDCYDETNYLNGRIIDWTFSPASFASAGYARVNTGGYTGSFNYNQVNVSKPVRPVISLKAGTTIYTSGTGTIDNPYEVNE